jgi:5'(3')-deoxyribonucleotidase
MNKFIINFDMDGVLIDTIKAVCDTYINRYHGEITSGFIPYPFPHKVRKWDMSDQLPLIGKEIDSIFQSEAFFNNASFITDPNGASMKSLFEELYFDNQFHVNIATKGTPINLALKKLFIRKEIPKFNMDNFIGLEGIGYGKQSISGYILIDDVVENLTSCNCKYKILFANKGILGAEWNKDYINHPEIIVCTTVTELCEKILELYHFEKIR